MTRNSGNHPNPGIHVLLQCAFMYLRSVFWQYVFSMTFKVTVRFAVNLLSQDYFLLVVIFLFIHIFFIVCVEHLEYSSSCKNVLLFLLQVTRQHKIVFNTTDVCDAVPVLLADGHSLGSSIAYFSRPFVSRRKVTRYVFPALF